MAYRCGASAFGRRQPACASCSTLIISSIRDYQQSSLTSNCAELINPSCLFSSYKNIILPLFRAEGSLQVLSNTLCFVYFIQISICFLKLGPCRCCPTWQPAPPA